MFKRKVPEETAELRVASIFNNKMMKPKKTFESSGAEISIIDVVCQ